MAVIDFWLMDAHRRDTIMVSSTSSGVTDGQEGGKGASRPPGKINSKIGSPLAGILIFGILLVFSRLLFLCVFRCVLVFCLDTYSTTSGLTLNKM